MVHVVEPVLERPHFNREGREAVKRVVVRGADAAMVRGVFTTFVREAQIERLADNAVGAVARIGAAVALLVKSADVALESASGSLSSFRCHTPTYPSLQTSEAVTGSGFAFP